MRRFSIIFILAAVVVLATAFLSLFLSFPVQDSEYLPPEALKFQGRVFTVFYLVTLPARGMGLLESIYVGSAIWALVIAVILTSLMPKKKN